MISSLLMGQIKKTIENNEYKYSDETIIIKEWLS